jgi:hypothetical protein
MAVVASVHVHVLLVGGVSQAAPFAGLLQSQHRRLLSLLDISGELFIGVFFARMSALYGSRAPAFSTPCDGWGLCVCHTHKTGVCHTGRCLLKLWLRTATKQRLCMPSVGCCSAG